ncbi:hypothetical protein AT5G55893 [Arabidopsis thaliana]|uniref:Uncharacterized protein n=2 Tax=Arabidopsis TaxID=3701 RepID=F4K6A1_ARATH|nr:uncharacterized protein AT5G55893 [Arabidopsis thaliana]NP_001330378.1 uncharacterized protein AT5G55893 [Arabidopsis thaliana]NP_001330379.1 uncharacterized protein AT5G55893 [Arabidopsis thaliana]AED96696.2 hypothetical protein AT5G55893 [Arabidopsis thaliana]ANM68648.1 hypothetical protein AT5G55893 [Arabidopsis thaliana]ANM68649.1 hypothetical protein AT5G55893 [Arabidopsis thaliana]|eukprot:NP_001318807.1 hypothetical protein AT5G55893 [Arabidopsis thaliana]
MMKEVLRNSLLDKGGRHFHMGGSSRPLSPTSQKEKKRQPTAVQLAEAAPERCSMNIWHCPALKFSMLSSTRFMSTLNDVRNSFGSPLSLTWSSLGTVLVARWIFEHISKTAHLNSAISASLVSPKTLARDANLSSLIASCLLKMVVDALKCVGERYTAGLPCTLLCGSRLVGRRLLGDVCSLFSCIGGEVLMIIPNAVPLGVGGSKGGATTILISVSFFGLVWLVGRNPQAISLPGTPTVEGELQLADLVSLYKTAQIINGVAKMKI